jgi:hypothetical protein
VTVYSLQIEREKKKRKRRFHHRVHRGRSAEGTEKSEEKSGSFVTLDRKNPPFAKSAKDGAPSSSLEGAGPDEERTQDPRAKPAGEAPKTRAQATRRDI